MKTQNQISVTFKQVLSANQTSKQISHTLPGVRGIFLSNYQQFTEDEQKEFEPFVKVLKASIKDSVIYKELLDTTKKSKSGNYSVFALLNAVRKQF